MHVKSQIQPRVINLQDVEEDMHTQYIQTAASTFEFRATVESTGIVEGLLRYHPFLYDHESYPKESVDPRGK